jgi:hypothetical protein
MFQLMFFIIQGQKHCCIRACAQGRSVKAAAVGHVTTPNMRTAVLVFRITM